MIVSPIPGQTPDRSSEHTLQGLASNLNAYAEQWTQIVTAGTTVDLTPAQVIAKNLRLDAGASGAFTIQLPPTSKIIDALGATVSVDGSYWFPLYIYNNSVGQTGTLVAGDADTTIDALNASVADGHVTKWMVNVEAAPNNSTPITLNFHNAWTACCQGVQPQTCPPDILPVVLEFPDNTVVQYDVTAPGTAFARTLDAATLGTGTITYAPDAMNRSAVYNAQDDKMYFLAVKTDSVGPVVTQMFVQFDPRTLTISGEMALPAGWMVAGSTLVDVTDTWAWVQSAFDGTFRAFDTVSFAEMFNDGGALATLAGGTTNASVSCNAGQILVPDATDITIIHLISVTGAASFTDAPIKFPTIGGVGPNFANTGSFRRRWIADRNKVICPYIGGGCVMLDLNDQSTQEMTLPAGDDISGTGPFWDSYGQRLVNNISGTDFGLWVGDDTGATLGIAAQNNGDWGGLNQTLGGLALANSFTFLGLGGFDENVPAFTAAETYETTDGFVSPGGKTFVPGNECVAIRRKGCTEIEAPQRGGGQPWESPVFRAYVPFVEGGSGQTITDTPASLLYFNDIDTAGWFDVPQGSSGGSVYTPQVRGYYGVGFGLSAKGSTGGVTMLFQLTASGAPAGSEFGLNAIDEFRFESGSGTGIVHCNGSTDQISLIATAGVGTTWDPGIASPFDPNGSCYFNVWLLKRD